MKEQNFWGESSMGMPWDGMKEQDNRPEVWVARVVENTRYRKQAYFVSKAKFNSVTVGFYCNGQKYCRYSVSFITPNEMRSVVSKPGNYDYRLDVPVPNYCEVDAVFDDYEQCREYVEYCNEEVAKKQLPYYKDKNYWDHKHYNDLMAIVRCLESCHTDKTLQNMVPIDHSLFLLDDEISTEELQWTFLSTKTRISFLYKCYLICKILKIKTCCN